MENQERRDNQLPYISDEKVMNEQKRARTITQQINTADRSDFRLLQGLFQDLFGTSGNNVFVNPPFYCDYGTNIHVGDNFMANYNCTILDVAKVIIGDNVMFAPNVAIYTAGHPIHPESRNSGYEYGIEIVIGNNVWVGGNVVITPGVHIGDNVVIGAGSVVTKDIPSNVVAAGNPCRIIKNITEEDKKYYYKDRCFDDEAWAKINASM